MLLLIGIGGCVAETGQASGSQPSTNATSSAKPTAQLPGIDLTSPTAVPTPTRDALRSALEQYLAAWRAGDLAALAKMTPSDSRSWLDGILEYVPDEADNGYCDGDGPPGGLRCWFDVTHRDGSVDDTMVILTVEADDAGGALITCGPTSAG